MRTWLIERCLLCGNKDTVVGIALGGREATTALNKLNIFPLGVSAL